MDTFVYLLLLAVTGGLLFFVIKIQRKQRWLSTVVATDPHLSRTLEEDRHLDGCLRYLCHLLQLEPKSVPPTGMWAASADTVLLPAEHVLSRKPRLIVEFACGVSTIVLARTLSIAGGGRIVSFEHDRDFAELTTARARRLGLDVDIRPVALLPADRLGHAGMWYDAELPSEDIDLLFVDGPPNSYHPETRGAAASAFGRLSPHGVIVLDDAARDGERAVAARWRSEFPEMTFTYIDGARGALFGSKRQDMTTQPRESCA